MFSDPLKNLKQFGISDHMIVADLGAGSGFYSILASHMVPAGKVYAVEVVPDFIKTIQNKIKEQHIKNIDCILGDVEKVGGTKIKDGVVDRVIASNILFQTEDKSKFLDEMKRILKPGGRVLLIDWEPEGEITGGGFVSMAKDKALALFEQKGFTYEQEVDAGDHHYGMIYRK